MSRVRFEASNASQILVKSLIPIGCGGRTRTYDHRINNPALYQLSYTTACWEDGDGRRMVVLCQRRRRESVALTVAQLARSCDTVTLMSKVAEVLRALRKEESRLRAELSGVERAIRALEEVLTAEGTAEAPQGVGAAGTEEPARLSPAAERPYALLHFTEAAAAHLAAIREPQTARQIAEALIAGGFPTRSKDFRASVRTMLGRTIPSDGIQRTADARWQSTAGQTQDDG